MAWDVADNINHRIIWTDWLFTGRHMREAGIVPSAALDNIHISIHKPTNQPIRRSVKHSQQSFVLEHRPCVQNSTGGLLFTRGTHVVKTGIVEEGGGAQLKL